MAVLWGFESESHISAVSSTSEFYIHFLEAISCHNPPPSPRPCCTQRSSMWPQHLLRHLLFWENLPLHTLLLSKGCLLLLSLAGSVHHCSVVRQIPLQGKAMIRPPPRWESSRHIHHCKSTIQLYWVHVKQLWEAKGRLSFRSNSSHR